jgi:hypothetical protein
MFEYIRSKEGEVQSGWRALGIERANNHWKIRVEDVQSGIIRTLETHQVILAVNPVAAKEILLASSHTKPQAEALNFPHQIHNVNVRLWFDTSPREGAPGGMFTGDFPIDNFFWLHRLHHEFEEWHRVTGGSVIETHIYGRKEMLALPEHLLIIAVTKEIYTAFPELRGHFVHGAVRDNGHNQTQFRIPTKETLHVETPWQDIFACGDWVGYPTPSLWMERCTITGIAAANAVLNVYEKPLFEIIPPSSPEISARLLGGIIRFLRRLLSPLLIPLARLFSRRRRTST